MKISMAHRNKKEIGIMVKIQTKATFNTLRKKSSVHAKTEVNKSIFKQMKCKTDDLMSTTNTNNPCGQKSHKSKNDFHKYQIKVTPENIKSASVKLPSPANVDFDDKQNNTLSNQTAGNNNPLNKNKTASSEITIQPREVSFEDLVRYTNIESRIRKDILSKFPTNSEIYLARIGRYIEKYYYNTFIHKKKWPSNVKFKDETIRTSKDFNCMKSKEQGDLSKVLPDTPRSKRIIESIGDDTNMLLNRPVTMLPSQISYEDFRNFTNIESCVHEDILRKDPKHAELHFSRVESYIKKYYDNYFLVSKKWPSRIKFLDKTIGSFDDLQRKKRRMRCGSPEQFKAPINQSTDVKNQSIHKTLVLPDTNDQAKNSSDQINKENRKNHAPTIRKTSKSNNVQKSTLNSEIDDAKKQRMDRNNTKLTADNPICNNTKSYMKSSKNLNLTFCDIPKYSKFSPSKNNCYMNAESELNPTESNVSNSRRKRKATNSYRDTGKKQCTNLSDSVKEETMSQPNLEGSCNSEYSTDSRFTSVSPFNGTTISQDNVAANLQLIKKEPDDNVTNEELDVLRNLCIKLEVEAHQENEMTDLIASQCEQEQTIEINVIKACLKKLSQIDSKSKETQETRVSSGEKSQPVIKTENFSEGDISSYSSDVNIIENRMNQSVVIADTGDTVEDLLELMMNTSDPSENIVTNKQIVKSYCNAGNSVNSLTSDNNNSAENNAPDLSIDEFFDELTQLLDDVNADSDLNQPNDNTDDSSPSLLPNNHTKRKKVPPNENDPSIQQTYSKDFLDKNCNKMISNLSVCTYAEKNHSNSSTPKSSLSTDYVSETTIFSDSSVIVPYQSTLLTNLSEKSIRPERKTREISRTKKFRRTKSMRSWKLRKSISNQIKSIVDTISQPSNSKKRKFNLISIKSKKGLIDPKKDNIQRVITDSEQMIKDKISDLTDDCEIEDVNRPEYELNRMIMCHSFQWTCSLHWQRVPNTILLTTQYESSIPLLNVVGVTPVNPNISLRRHQILSIKIFNENVYFHMNIDASNEDAMYSLLETSLQGAGTRSSMDLVALRYLQTIFDYFPPICLEKQNIYITDTAPAID